MKSLEVIKVHDLELEKLKLINKIKVNYKQRLKEGPSEDAKEEHITLMDWIIQEIEEMFEVD